MSIRTDFQILMNKVEDQKVNNKITHVLNEGKINEAKVDLSNFYEEIKNSKKKVKSKSFKFFLDNLPKGEIETGTLSHLASLQEEEVKEFIDKLQETPHPTSSFNVGKGLESKIFQWDAKGIGKGEIYCAWIFKDAIINGGGKSFDVGILPGGGNSDDASPKYEVKDYSGKVPKEGKNELDNTGAIRVGVEGSVSKFAFWDVILQTVQIVKKIDTGEGIWDMLPPGPDLEELKKLKDYILKRVLQQTKIVTGEFNKTDTGKFVQFYRVANRVISSAESSEDYNQIILKGPNQKPKSIIIEPISGISIPANGAMSVNIKDSTGKPKRESVINYLNKLEYLRKPEKFEKDLKAAVAEIIKDGLADYWMVFRGKASSIKGKIIPRSDADKFEYSSISQNGIKFKEP
jgi:hypothetical protein